MRCWASEAQTRESRPDGAGEFQSSGGGRTRGTVSLVQARMDGSYLFAFELLELIDRIEDNLLACPAYVLI